MKLRLRPLRVLEFVLITVPGLIGLVLALRAAGPLIDLVRAELGRTPEVQEVEATLTAWTRAGTSPEQIDAGLAQAFAEDDIDGAAVWLKVAEITGYPVKPEWRARFEDETSTASTAVRATRQAVAGAVTGEGRGVSGLAGAFAADMTFVGDLRDIGRELWHFGNSEPVDELALGLSGIGLTLTAATYGSGGAAALPRGAVSAFKIARRTGRLSARFAERLGRMVADVSISRPCAARCGRPGGRTRCCGPARSLPPRFAVTAWTGWTRPSAPPAGSPTGSARPSRSSCCAMSTTCRTCGAWTRCRR